MTMLFNADNHINLIQAEIDAANESMAAYGMYCTVVVEGKLAKARRDNTGLNIIGSDAAGADSFEVFPNEAAANELVKWHQFHGQTAKVMLVDLALTRYIGHLRAAVHALGGAVNL